MVHKNPIGRPVKFSGKVLDHRNTLTGPDDSGKAGFPKRPQNISIGEQGRK